MSEIKIVLAEDHKLFRQTLVSALKQLDIHTIGEACNGIDLLNLLKITKPDVVLMDIEMPEMDGCNALEKIKLFFPTQKVIILTQHSHDFLGNFLISKGADAFLTKNTEIEILVNTIKSVHENKYKAKNVSIFKSSEKEEIKFSKREAELIPQICEGKSNKEIADKLNIGNKTVEAHKKNLFRKTNTLGTVNFVAYLFKKGLNFLK
jgi:DNA-binding NarL/FixJ family response regulator